MRESACCALLSDYSRPSSSDDSRLTKPQHAMVAGKHGYSEHFCLENAAGDAQLLFEGRRVRYSGF